MKIARYSAFTFLAVIYPWIALGSYSAISEATWVRLGLFSGFVFLGAVILKTARPGASWGLSFATAALLYGTVYRLAIFIPDLSNYPFSLGWSEASRYYYASLFLPDKVYGAWTPPSVLHPSRYLMQAMPFLLSGLPLLAHRAWQVLLWIALPLAAGNLLANRLSIQDWFTRAIFIAWSFLFLFQGPLYYHLLIMVILVLWGFDRRRFWRSLFIVLVASAWAGISRINWLPVPGLLAAALYFLESRMQGDDWPSYLVKPALWTVLGTLLAFGVQLGYERFSGNPAEYFGSSFTSDLLWYRLFPSVTYPLGVLPAAFLVSMPLLLMIFSLGVQRTPGQSGGWQLSYHPMRLLGLGVILFVLGAGGIVVSVKIGGGSNLHNLDAFLVLLWVTGSYMALGRFAKHRILQDEPMRPSPLLVSLCIMIPVGMAITQGGALQIHDPEQAAAALDKLNQSVKQLAPGGGEVLWISERHLLTFDYLDSNPVVHEYEKVFLMEMAMAGSTVYFEGFYQDLENHRFQLIISDPLWPHYQGRAHSFGEENDAWVRWVVAPLLCTYEEWDTIPEVPLTLLVPKEEASACPYP
jgi:hypothetical protein